jgi:Protein of unknown function (DUF3309)
MRIPLGVVLLIAMIVAVAVTIPIWPYSRRWGYGPSGILAAITVIVVILLADGRL